MKALLAIVLTLFSASASRAAEKACGWYVITACRATYDEANAFAKKTGSGFIVNTSSPDYRNFQSGYYCVVAGPSSRETALGAAQFWRSKSVPDAYAKNAC